MLYPPKLGEALVALLDRVTTERAHGLARQGRAETALAELVATPVDDHGVLEGLEAHGALVVLRHVIYERDVPRSLERTATTTEKLRHQGEVDGWLSG